MPTTLAPDGTPLVQETPVVPATATLTAGMSPTEAKTILSNLGINVNDVLGATNVQQTIQSPAPAPDDLLGIRSSIMNELGVNTAQQNYLNAVKAAQGGVAGLNENLTALAGRPVSMSKIVGQQAQQRAVSANEIARLQDAQSLALQDLQAKKAEAETQFGIREGEIKEKRSYQMQFPGAGITVSDSFDSVAKKLDTYQTKVKKEAYKDSLKQTAMSLGIKTKGKSTKKLEKAISKASKSALNQAKKSADADYQLKLMQIKNVQIEIANRGKSGAGSKNDLASMGSVLSGRVGNDGRLSPQDYNYAKNAWVSGNNKASDFDANFSHLVNPADPQDYNLSYSTLKGITSSYE